MSFGLLLRKGKEVGGRERRLKKTTKRISKGKIRKQGI